MVGAAPVHPSSPWSQRGRHPQRSPRCSGRASSEPGAPGTPVCPVQGMQPLARPGRVLPCGVMCVSESSPRGGGPGLEMKPGGWLQRRQGGERLAGCLPANEQPAAAGRAAGGQLPSPSLGAGSPAGLWGCPPFGAGARDEGWRLVAPRLSPLCRIRGSELRGEHRRLSGEQLQEWGHLRGRRQHLQLPVPTRVDR